MDLVREEHLVLKPCLYAATESSNRQRTLTGASQAADQAESDKEAVALAVALCVQLVRRARQR